ncbi:uncharacterized protein LOC115836413 [Nomascus leucogenys]|uniref:uncharacterized protein LOC115836413 n=1 Tax=Nomascus leucogenys TaxID=61853 RepID=UPI00122D96C9|nr:uncharacterized protein LOC115836413 [Nomascus leucogenys]
MFRLADPLNVRLLAGDIDQPKVRNASIPDFVTHNLLVHITGITEAILGYGHSGAISLMATSGRKWAQAPPGNLSPEAAASCKLGGAGCAAGPQRPGARPWCWRQGGRGRWRVQERRVSHTRRLGRRRQWQRQAPPGRARARGRRLPPSVARCLSRPHSPPLRGRARPSARRKEEGSQGRREVPAAAADPGQGGGCGSDGAGARSTAGGVRPQGPRRGALGPSALPRAVGRDPMRRAHEGRESPSSGGARRRAVLQLLEPESCRQEAAAART